MQHTNQYRANWNFPTAIRAGVGRVNELVACCRELNITAPLLVTDPFLASLPMVTSIVADCASNALNIAVFSDIKPNPTGKNVTQGTLAYLSGNHDGIIAIGGGSSLDTGKAIAAVVNQSCALWDLEDVADNWQRAQADLIPPIIAIPTTAGTGSEVGRAALIVNEDEARKVIVFHPKLLPAIVFLDAQLTQGLPAPLTAATGMDALSHNLEAYCAPTWHPMADGIAIEGMRLIKEHLPTAVADGSNLKARAQMLIASSMGATAFQKGLGAMHALAHPLGAHYDAHHGLLNAVLMPYVLQANRAMLDERIRDLARCLDLDPEFDAFIAWILEFRTKLGIPHRLCDILTDDQHLEQIGEQALADPSAVTNPTTLSASGYQSIARNAWDGIV